MGLEERRERWQSMMSTLRASSVQDWFSDFLQALDDVRRAPARHGFSRPAALPIVHDVAGGMSAHGH